MCNGGEETPFARAGVLVSCAAPCADSFGRVRGYVILSRSLSSDTGLKRTFILYLVQLFDGKSPQDLALVTLEGSQKGLVDLLLRLNE